MKILELTINVFLLWFLCAAQLNYIFQPDFYQTAELGDTVNLRCRIYGGLRVRVWYKLTTTRRLQLVASTDTFYNLTTNGEQSDQRYSVESGSTSNILKISTTKWEDTGTYYCGVMTLNDIKFGFGTLLVITGVKQLISDSVVQHPESRSVQPGDSVTLVCSVHVSHCPAEHVSITWIKDSHSSASKVIYSVNKNDTCQENDTDFRETACKSSLLMRNLRSADAGTYCCVVTSCGETLVGKGTRIHINKNDAFTDPADLSPAVIALTVSNIILLTAVIVLMCVKCTHRNKDLTGRRGSVERNQPEVDVIYEAVASAPRGSRAAPTQNKEDAVVYSAVRSSQHN